jgi:site-specific recombinase XerD
MNKNNKVGGGDFPRRIQAIPIVTATTENKLTSRQLADYEDHRRSFIKWLLNLGKTPDRGEGYATETARVRASRADQFYRWVWEQEEGYTTAVTHEHADAYMKKLAYEDETDGSKANKMKAIKTLFRWKAQEFGDEGWEPEIKFSNHTSTTNPKELLTMEERKKSVKPHPTTGASSRQQHLSGGAVLRIVTTV